MRVENVAAPHEGAGPAPPLLGWSCSRRFQARPDVVSTELVGLNQTLVQLGLPIEPLFTLELVLAEVLNNIVEHAYGDTGQGMIGMSMVVREHRITCDSPTAARRCRTDVCRRRGGTIRKRSVCRTCRRADSAGG